MFTRICREIVDVAIYALYPESFCGVNLAIRKVFAFSDSACNTQRKMEESLAGFGDFVHHLLFTFVSGPLKVDSLGWVKYCRLRLEYFRNVSAVLRARVQA